MRSYWLSLLLCCACHSDPSVHSTSSFGDPDWRREAIGWTPSIGASYYEIFGDFRIGDQRERWDRARRYELVLQSREPLHGKVEAILGSYLFYEERDWAQGASRVLFDSFGFGFDAGAMLYPYENANQRKIAVGLLPSFRLGMGFNDGDFRNIDVNLDSGPALSDGSIGNLRFDVGLGLETRVVLGRVFFVGLGTGVNWWTTARGTGSSTNSGSSGISVANDSIGFHGKETYGRASLGVFF